MRRRIVIALELVRGHIKGKKRDFLFTVSFFTYFPVDLHTFLFSFRSSIALDKRWPMIPFKLKLEKQVSILFEVSIDSYIQENIPRTMTLICNHAVMIDPSTYKNSSTNIHSVDTNNDEDEANHFTVSDWN
jgi:hypothetical protein